MNKKEFWTSSLDRQIRVVENEEKRNRIRSIKRIKIFIKVLIILFLCFYALLSIYPFVWSIAAAFHTPSQIRRLELIPWLPDSIFTTKNFTGFFNQGITQRYGTRWLFNSAIYSTLNATINCFFNFLAGYALARIAFGTRKSVIWFMLAGTMIPVQATQIPQLIILIRLGFISNTSPYFVFMMGILSSGMTSTILIFQVRQFYLNQSSSIEEAGLVDGLSRFKVFLKVSLRSMFPLLATQWAMVFIGSWNNFIMFQLWSFGKPDYLNFVGGLIVTSQDKESFDGMGRLLAGTNFSILPVLGVYLISLKFQRKIMVEGEK